MGDPNSPWNLADIIVSPNSYGREEFKKSSQLRSHYDEKGSFNEKKITVSQTWISFPENFSETI